MSDKPNPWTTSAPLSAASPRLWADRGPEDELREHRPLAAAHGPSDAALARRAELDGQELHAILGAGTAVHGTLSFSGHVRIDGEFSGQVLGGQTLVIGALAKVQGELRAERVVVLGGLVEADIVASEAIELYIPAQVIGDLRAPEVHMEKGVRFVGTCDLSELAHP